MISPDVVKGIIALLVILSVLVIVHEWGHYIAARLCGMRVEDFSLFFGKVIWRIGKKGNTVFNVRAIPLGGFVRIAGMDPDDISGGKPILEALRDRYKGDMDTMDSILARLDSDTMVGIDVSQISGEIRDLVHQAVGPDGNLTANGREELQAMAHSPRITTDEHKLIQLVLNAHERANDPELYSSKPIYQRALVIFAGPLASLLFGYILFCALGATIGLPNDRPTNQIEIVNPDGAAKRAGLRIGDRIIAIDGVPTPDGKAMVQKIHSSANKPIVLTVQRGDQIFPVTVTPRPQQIPDGKNAKKTIGLIGIVPKFTLQRLGVLESIRVGTITTRNYVITMLNTLVSKKVKDSVGGPIAMGQMATALQKLGLAHLVMMAAAFSLSLGIMNLLPIPILDGGHLMLLTIEKLRRRKLSPREVYRAQMIGFGILALLIGFVMINDISRTLAGNAFQ